MKTLYNAVISPIDLKTEHHVGLYDALATLELGVTAMLYSRIKPEQQHFNNAVIVPPLYQSTLLNQSVIELPVALALWNESVSNWSHISFILTIRQIPLLVTQADVYAYIGGTTPQKGDEVK